MSSNNSRGGLGLGTVITIIFVVLKVLNVPPVASWSWVWVLSPLWISFLLSLVFLAIAGIVVFAINEASTSRSRRGYSMRVTPGKRPMYTGLPNNEKVVRSLGRNY